MDSSNTVTFSGSFVSTGSAQVIQFPSGVDWLQVINYTVAGANQTTAIGVQYYWQNGMAAGTGIEYKKSSAANAANLTQALTTGGFTLVDTSKNPVGNINSTITAVSNASPPVVTNTGTNGLLPGSVVRLYNIAGAQQLGGYDFTVGYNTLSTTTFSLDYMATIVAGTTGSWAVIAYDPIFYPPHRFITKITSSGVNTVITLSVTHKFTVGQEVRVIVPPAFGMTQINGLQGTIIAIDTTTTTGNTITLNIDSSAFTAFAFPLTAAVPFSPAMIVPIGEAATSPWQNLLDDATINTAYMGMILAAGANSPAGQTNDVIYWIGGTTFNG